MDESMEIMVDTSILIDHLRKTKKKETVFYQLFLKNTLYISNVTKFELDIGVNQSNKKIIEELYDSLIVLPLSISCTDKASEIYQFLKTKNLLIGIPDLFIASTAIIYEMPLATFNINHFSRIPNLQVL